MGKLDRFTKILLCLLVTGVWGLLLAPFFQVQPVEAQSKASSVKWEYMFVDPDRSALNAFGNQGWEAVAIAPHDALVLMKRRR